MMRFEPWGCEVSGICLVGGMIDSMHYKKSNSSIQTAGHNIKGLLLSHRLLLGIQLLGPLSDGLYKVCMKCSLLFSSITPSQNCGGTNRI